MSKLSYLLERVFACPIEGCKEQRKGFKEIQGHLIYVHLVTMIWSLDGWEAKISLRESEGDDFEKAFCVVKRVGHDYWSAQRKANKIDYRGQQIKYRGVESKMIDRNSELERIVMETQSESSIAQISTVVIDVRS